MAMRRIRNGKLSMIENGLLKNGASSSGRDSAQFNGRVLHNSRQQELQNATSNQRK
jgi:hypothetical protein